MTQSFEHAHAYLFETLYTKTAVTKMLVRDADDNESEVIH